MQAAIYIARGDCRCREPPISRRPWFILRAAAAVIYCETPDRTPFVAAYDGRTVRGRSAYEAGCGGGGRWWVCVCAWWGGAEGPPGPEWGYDDNAPCGDFPRPVGPVSRSTLRAKGISRGRSIRMPGVTPCSGDRFEFVYRVAPLARWANNYPRIPHGRSDRRSCRNSRELAARPPTPCGEYIRPGYVVDASRSTDTL